MENLTTELFKEKIFDYENNSEWKFKGNKPTIIDFSADWCAPCKIVDPILQELSEEYEGKINFYKIDIEDEYELAVTFSIKSIPALLFIPIEEQPQMSMGAMQKEGFKDAIYKVFDIPKNG